MSSEVLTPETLHSSTMSAKSFDPKGTAPFVNKSVSEATRHAYGRALLSGRIRLETVAVTVSERHLKTRVPEELPTSRSRRRRVLLRMILHVSSSVCELVRVGFQWWRG